MQERLTLVEEESKPKDGSKRVSPFTEDSVEKKLALCGGFKRRRKAPQGNGLVLQDASSWQLTPWWTARDVAEYFGVRVGAVYRWVREGGLPVHKTPGGGFRFVESEVKAAQPK